MALEAPRHISETCQKWLLAFSPLGIHVHRVPEALSGFVRGGGGGEGGVSRQEWSLTQSADLIFSPQTQRVPSNVQPMMGRMNEKQQINWGFHNP